MMKKKIKIYRKYTENIQFLENMELYEFICIVIDEKLKEKLHNHNKQHSSTASSLMNNKGTIIIHY